MWYSKVDKQLVDEDIVAEKGNGLREDRIIVVEGGGNNPVIEDRVGEDIDEKDFSLSNRKAEEVDGDLIGRGVQD